MNQGAAPLLQLAGITREFVTGDTRLLALREVSLDIHAGEMLAIMGASGSGKSTLMHIIGCLDQPTCGSYRVQGRETGAMQPDELARLRREHFGFIFQRYQLIGSLTAQGNVEVPAIYAGADATTRKQRAQALLHRLGLGERMGHLPSQLSGGQQQRVSIARALMNGGKVILADEPTGALDSASGEEVMRILKALNAEGHTVIIVTHDAQVAAHCQRVVSISDGQIVQDRRNGDAAQAGNPVAPDAVDGFAAAQPKECAALHPAVSTAWLGRLGEAFRMALRAMLAHKMRTFLTMLGIIIGIASVASVTALGAGGREKVMADINAMGTNTIDILPGSGFGDRQAGSVRTLVAEDAAALAAMPDVDSVTPGVSTSALVRSGSTEKNATVQGVGAQFFRVRGYTLVQGAAFSAASVENLAQDAVIDDNTRKAFFAHRPALGETLLVGNTLVRITGVTAPRSGFAASGSGLTLWLPYTTVMGRFTGNSQLNELTVRVKDGAPMQQAENRIVQTLTLRHGRKDFFLVNSDSIRQTVEKTTQTLTLLVSAIALIALVVGGIGVMNIMLVSVTERTQEIGVRMAIGARQGDILQQFLIEAIMVCLAGGLLGVLLALGLGALFGLFVQQFSMVFSATSIVASVLCCTLIGLCFGFLPARRAARMNPVDALARH